MSPADPTGIVGIRRICITPDRRTVAYEYIRMPSYCYVLDGLARPAVDRGRELSLKT